MKRFFSALVLATTGISLHAAGWLSHGATPRVETRREVSDPFASEAALRHRDGAPNHWRAMLMPR